jgi:hypothetical protein
MNVVDKIVNEWAFRCKKGYPDMNNPDDMKILKEIYSEYGVVIKEEEQSQQQAQQNNVSFEDLQTLIDARKDELTQDQINKLYKIISKTGKGYTKSLLTILEETKKLKRQQAIPVASLADKYNFEDKIIDSINNPANTFLSLGSEGNLTTKLQEITGIDSTHIDTIIGLTVGGGQKGVGKGEIAIISFLHDTTSAAKGDVQTKEGPVEFKGTDAILAASKFTTRGVGVDQIFADIIKILNIPEDQQANLTGTPGKQEGNWIDKLVRYTQDKTQIQKVLDKFYYGLVKIGDTDTTSANAVKTAVAKDLAKNYIKTINEPIFFISENNDYKIYRTEEEIVLGMGVDLFVSKFSDLVPRLVFKKEPESKK